MTRTLSLLQQLRMQNPMSAPVMVEGDGASAFEGDHPDPVEELVKQVPDLQLPCREASQEGCTALMKLIWRQCSESHHEVHTFLIGVFRGDLVHAMDEAWQLCGSLYLANRQEDQTPGMFFFHASVFRTQSIQSKMCHRVCGWRRCF